MTDQTRKRKIDINLDSTDSFKLDSDTVKAGEAVQFDSKPDGSITCTTTSRDPPVELGFVPLAHCPDISTGQYQGAIRTIQRSKDTPPIITGIVVRCQYNEQPGLAPKHGENICLFLYPIHSITQRLFYNFDNQYMYTIMQVTIHKQ